MRIIVKQCLLDKTVNYYGTPTGNRGRIIKRLDHYRSTASPTAEIGSCKSKIICRPWVHDVVRRIKSLDEFVLDFHAVRWVNLSEKISWLTFIFVFLYISYSCRIIIILWVTCVIIQRFRLWQLPVLWALMSRILMGLLSTARSGEH